MPLFTVTHRIKSVTRTNQVSISAVEPDEALDEIKAALAHDHIGVTATDVEIINVVSAEQPKAIEVAPKVEAKPEPTTTPEPTPEETPPAPVETPASAETPESPEAEQPKAARHKRN